PVRADLPHRDAAPRELLREKIGRLAQAAARDELPRDVRARAGRQAHVGRRGVCGIRAQPARKEQRHDSTHQIAVIIPAGRPRMRTVMMLLAVSLAVGAGCKKKEGGGSETGSGSAGSGSAGAGSGSAATGSGSATTGSGSDATAGSGSAGAGSGSAGSGSAGS